MSGAAALRNIDAGQTAQNIIYGGRLPAFNILTRHDGNGRQNRAARLLKTVGGDNRVSGLVSCAQAEKAVTENAVSSVAF